jgi:hypothetical protein
MKVTIIQDVCGYLHIFVGSNINITNDYKRKNKYHFSNNKSSFCIEENSQADMFFQSDIDIDVIKENLSKTKLDKLNNGYKITTSIDMLYFEGNINFHSLFETK